MKPGYLYKKGKCIYYGFREVHWSIPLEGKSGIRYEFINITRRNMWWTNKKKKLDEFIEIGRADIIINIALEEIEK